MMDEWNRIRSLQRDHGEFDAEAENPKPRSDDTKKEFDDALDRGLEDSFPGSDPVSVTQPPPSPHDKRTP
jgi:hypothetical protein